MSALDDICAYADRKLAGSTLTFALVVWVKGQADNPKSVSLSSPPESQADATTALRTTADAQDAARPSLNLRSPPMDSRYLRPGFEFALAHLVEECGEVLAAAGKTQRWGPQSVNPELPPEQQETNAAWLRRELADLRGAMDRLEAEMQREAG